MSQAARKLFASVPFAEATTRVAIQEHGVVLRISGSMLVVGIPSGEVEAKRARSCLVEPLLRDSVLLSRVPGEKAFVLAVLERDDEATTLSVEGDLSIRPNGRLAVRSEKGVDIESTSEVRIASKELVVQASRASVVLGQLSVLGAKLLAEFTDTRILGDTIESVFQRVSQAMKRSFRRVEETDHVDVRDARWNIEETLNVHASNTVVTSKELVKLDGNQIHLG